MDLDKILKNNEEWAADRLSVDADYFEHLAKGQNPGVLYIGCSDSRVTAEEMMGAVPGDLFVHRNIANVVPNTDINVMSVINFAVMHLKVDHIIVCGHYGCGGVKAAMQQADLGILNPWLREIRDVYRMHRDEMDAIKDEEAKYRRLVELNVQEQCINVLKTADVQRAYKDRHVTMNGWVFDIASGRIVDLKIDFEKILSKIQEIYRVD
jgi:carbonic anhydrase